MVGNIGRTIGYDRAGNPVGGLEIIVPRRHDQDRLPGGGAAMTLSPLDEFLAYELDEWIRSELVAVINEMATGQRYFTYNAFNVLLDADASTVTVEDELDANRQSTVGLQGFGAMLRSSESP